MKGAETTVTIDELTLADEARSWSDLGFAVEGELVHIGGVCVRCAGTGAGRGVVGWSLREASSSDLDGLPTSVSERPPREPAPEHPNGVVALDHVVAFSPSLDRSIAALQAAGLDLRRIREEPTPAGAPRQAFFRLGAEILEVVQMPDEMLAQDGARERPARLWGLALTVRDLQATLERLGEHVGEARAAVQSGRTIATLRRSAGLAVPVALMSGAEGGA